MDRKEKMEIKKVLQSYLEGTDFEIERIDINEHPLAYYFISLHIKHVYRTNRTDYSIYTIYSDRDTFFFKKYRQLKTKGIGILKFYCNFSTFTGIEANTSITKNDYNQILRSVKLKKLNN